jgi:hypothetical protein
MMPYTKADEIQTQRLQAAMAQVTKDLHDGVIDQSAHDYAVQQIQTRLAPLLQRKQESEQQAEQQASMMALRQHAQMQAMEQQAREYRAKGFLDTMVVRVDPLTGRVATFYEQSPNHWAEVEYKGTPREPKMPTVEEKP